MWNLFNFQVKNDDKAFEVSLDTHHFRPDELKVNVHDNTLSVEAKHEEKSDDGISRYFLLPVPDSNRRT